MPKKTEKDRPNSELEFTAEERDKLIKDLMNYVPPDDDKRIVLVSIEGLEQQCWDSLMKIIECMYEKKSVPWKVAENFINSIQPDFEEDQRNVQKYSAALADEVYDKLKGSVADFSIHIINRTHFKYSDFFEMIMHHQDLDDAYFDIHGSRKIKGKEENVSTYRLLPLLLRVAHSMYLKFLSTMPDQWDKKSVSQAAFLKIQEELNEIPNKKASKDKTKNKPSRYYQIAMAGLIDAYFRREPLKLGVDSIKDYHDNYRYFIEEIGVKSIDKIERKKKGR